MTKTPEKQRSAGDRRGPDRRAQPRRASGARGAFDRRLQLRDAMELIGFGVHTSEGLLGRIENFRVEQDSWGITDVLVTAKRPVGGQEQLLVPLHAIERVDRRRRKIYVRRRSASRVRP